MCQVFVADPKVVWLSLWHPHSTRELIQEGRGKPSEILGGQRVREAAVPVMNSVCGFRRGWLRQVGGLHEDSAFYGGLECCMWEKVKKHGRWVFLEDYKEDLHFHDRVSPHYRDWKWAHAHQGLKGSFEDYLRGKGIL
jgi:hypothetical protein